MEAITEEEMVVLKIVPFRERLRAAGISDKSERWYQLGEHRRKLLNREYADGSRKRKLGEIEALEEEKDRLLDEINQYQTVEALDAELRDLQQECESLKRQCRRRSV